MANQASEHQSRFGESRGFDSQQIELRHIQLWQSPDLWRCVRRSTVAIVLLLVSVDGPYAVGQDDVAEEVVVEVLEMEEFGADFPVDPETAKLRAHLAVRRALVGRVCKLTDQQQKETEVDG